MHGQGPPVANHEPNLCRIAEVARRLVKRLGLAPVDAKAVGVLVFAKQRHPGCETLNADDSLSLSPL
jgi:hypothetical protein